MATNHIEKLGYGFCLELRDTALVDVPFAVDFYGRGVFTKTNYFSTYEEALQFFDFKVLEIHQVLDCFLKVEGAL